MTFIKDSILIRERGREGECQTGRGVESRGTYTKLLTLFISR